MKIVIIGAGIAGSMAAGAFSSYNPIVIDATSGPKKHTAVMRLRDPNVGKLLGVPLEEIIVQKGIYCEDNILKANNQYSLKLYRELGKRSLLELGDVKRYLIKNNFTPRWIHLDRKVIEIKPGWVTAQNLKEEKFKLACDICISTIPMPQMLKILKISFEKSWGDYFKYEPVFVYRSKLKVKSSIHQTLYIPNIACSPYRMTIEGEDIIVESSSAADEEGFLNMLIENGFGVKKDQLYDWTVHKMQYGKIISIDDDVRRYLIMKLTKDYNIYSLGRHAIWKSIRTDHLLKDIDKIAHMIRISKVNQEYLQRLEE